MSVGHLYVLFGEMSLQVLDPVFDRIACVCVCFFFSIIELCEFLRVLRYQPCIGYIIFEYILSFGRLSSCSVDFLCCAEAS